MIGLHFSLSSQDLMKLTSGSGQKTYGFGAGYNFGVLLSAHKKKTPVSIFSSQMRVGYFLLEGL